MLPADDGTGVVDLTDAPPGSWAPGPRAGHHDGRRSGQDGPRRPRGWVPAAVAAALVVALGLVAHARAPRAVARVLPADVPRPGAYQDAVEDALRAAAPGVAVQWQIAGIITSGAPDSPPVDLQHDAPVAAPLTAPVRGRVGYRVLDGLPAGVERRPCRVRTVQVEAWQYAQGGEQSLSCRSWSPGARGGEAVLEGTSAVPVRGASAVAVREVVVVERGRSCAAAAWAVGPDATPPLDVDALRRVARALADVRGAPA